MGHEQDVSGRQSVSAPRDLLVEALSARMRESLLAYDRVEAKLRDALGPGARGVSKSSLSRYLDPVRTELPQPSVLAALADIFGVGEDELAQWQEWRRLARVSQKQGSGPRRPEAPSRAPADTVAPAGDGAGSAGDVTSDQPSAAASGGSREPFPVRVPQQPGGETAVRPDKPSSRRWWVAAVGVMALVLLAVAGMVGTGMFGPARAPARIEGGAAGSDAAGGCRGVVTLAHAPLRANPCVRVVNGQLELASSVVALQSGTYTVFVWLTDGNTYRPDVPPHRCTVTLQAGQAATCSVRTTPDRPGTSWQAATAARAGQADVPDGWQEFPDVTGTQSGHPVTWPLPSLQPSAVPTTAPLIQGADVEKGTLGEDSRCGPPVQGPAGVVWRVCARVQAAQVSFALKITNVSSAASTLKIRLQYVQAGTFRSCPGWPGTEVMTVAGGQTRITDTKRCSVARAIGVPYAYQGVGWVLPADTSSGTYRLSPTAHIYPDHVIWQPDAL
ncbi:helix-turn-helix transcriptional regulator [Streptomyces sp. NPDC001851]|uniref:helix-turn-helix domain-containing protein n=1 Tax=Streptomyces sp. NPDC001851 TaxID=3154529 RepID=UPI00331A1C43